MSTHYTAYTIIGSLVDMSDFSIHEEKSVHKSCREMGSGPYCSNCGRSIHEVVATERDIEGYEGPDGKGIEYHGKFYGLHVVDARTPDGELYFVAGAIAESGDYAYGSERCTTRMPCDAAELARAKRAVRDALSKAGLWDETKFGIWTVLHCSY